MKTRGFYLGHRFLLLRNTHRVQPAQGTGSLMSHGTARNWTTCKKLQLLVFACVSALLLRQSLLHGVGNTTRIDSLQANRYTTSLSIVICLKLQTLTSVSCLCALFSLIVHSTLTANNNTQYFKSYSIVVTLQIDKYLMQFVSQWLILIIIIMVTYNTSRTRESGKKWKETFGD
jgi:hypothetical protein